MADIYVIHGHHKSSIMMFYLPDRLHSFSIFPGETSTRDSCRWLNLWIPLNPAIDLDTCNLEDSEGGLGLLVFMGNLALVIAILLGVFFLHVTVVSGVEAYWLWRVSHRAHF